MSALLGIVSFPQMQVEVLQGGTSCTRSEHSQGESRRHRGLGSGSDVRHHVRFPRLLECKYLKFMRDTPRRSAWMLLASLPKFHFHPAIVRGFQRPFVSLCHCPGEASHMALAWDRLIEPCGGNSTALAVLGDLWFDPKGFSVSHLLKD